MDAAFLELLNSEGRDYRGGGRMLADRLRERGWIEAFLARWTLAVTPPLDDGALAGLVELRALLRRMTEAIAGGRAPSAADMTALNAVLHSAPVTPRLARTEAGYRLETAPLRQDWAWVRAEIAASFADVLAAHDARRLKVCANADCRWAFYDESKSRTRRWCDESACGNLLKVRRFRERQNSTAKSTTA